MENPDSNWLGTVERAATKDEVIDIARAYVVACVSVLESIPAECRPGYIADVTELSETAFALSSASRAAVGRPESNAALERVARFFEAAANRAAVLASHAPTRRYFHDMDVEQG